MTTVDVKSLACAEAERLARARRLIAGPPNGSRSLHVGADQRVRPGADTSVGPYIDGCETASSTLDAERTENGDCGGNGLKRRRREAEANRSVASRRPRRMCLLCVPSATLRLRV